MALTKTQSVEVQKAYNFLAEHEMATGASTVRLPRNDRWNKLMGMLKLRKGLSPDCRWILNQQIARVRTSFLKEGLYKNLLRELGCLIFLSVLYNRKPRHAR